MTDLDRPIVRAGQQRLSIRCECHVQHTGLIVDELHDLPPVVSPPYPDGLVEGAGHEAVIDRGHLKRDNASFVALEVLKVLVVVQRMIANGVVLLGRRVKNCGILVRKTGKIDTVLFGV